MLHIILGIILRFQKPSPIGVHLLGRCKVIKSFKNLKFTWETDPNVKAWKDECRRLRLASGPDNLAFPTRVKVDGEWVTQSGLPKQINYPPDPRTDEERRFDWLVDRVKVWDRREQKSHVYSIKLLKNELRRDLKTIHQLKNGTYKQLLIKMDFSRALENLKHTEYMNNPTEKIHWTMYVDYVNERFGLNIRKDLFTDKELEKSKVIIDVPNTPLAIGGTDAT